MVGGMRERGMGDVDRGLAWALIGLVLYVACGVAAIFGVAAIESGVLTPIGLGAEPGTQGWGLYLASHDLAWGALAALAAGWAGRRLVPGLRIATIVPIVVLVVGVMLAATTTFALHEWVRARYALFDPEYAGPVFFAAPALVAVALGGWASLAMPARLRRPLVVETVAAGTGFAIATLPSLGGLSDGLAASSGPLALALGLDAAFVPAVIVAVVLGRRDG